MPPNQYNPQLPNQYDFFLNNQPQSHGPRLNGSSTRARILIVVVGLVLLLILAVGVKSLLNKGNQTQIQRLTDVAQAESEVIRISSLGVDQAKATDTQNFAATTKISVESSQVQTKAMLAKYGIKGKKLTKALAGSKNSKNDAALTEATNNNRYDETLLTLLNKQLADYQKLAQTAQDSGKPSEKKILQASRTNAVRLLPKSTSH